MKEKKLAEKRKNDPLLELSTDHPVRKLISKFRRLSDNKRHSVAMVENMNCCSNEFNIFSHALVSNQLTQKSNERDNISRLAKEKYNTTKWTSIFHGRNRTVVPIISYNSENTTAGLSLTETLLFSNSSTDNQLDRVKPERKSVQNTVRWSKLLTDNEDRSSEMQKETTDRKFENSGAEDRYNKNLPNAKIFGSLSDNVFQDLDEFQNMIESLTDIRLEMKNNVDALVQKICQLETAISALANIARLNIHANCIKDFTASHSMVSLTCKSVHITPTRRESGGLYTNAYPTENSHVVYSSNFIDELSVRCCNNVIEYIPKHPETSFNGTCNVINKMCNCNYAANSSDV